METIKNGISRLRNWWDQHRNFYKCTDCGFMISKKEACLGGWPDHPYGLHVHCQSCGKVIAQQQKKRQNNI